MNTFSEDFKSLEQNVRQLIRKNKNAEDALVETRKSLVELKEISFQQVQEIEKLVEKNKILRIVGGNKDGDSREIKLKINEIVREVNVSLN